MKSIVLRTITAVACVATIAVAQMTPAEAQRRMDELNRRAASRPAASRPATRPRADPSPSTQIVVGREREARQAIPAPQFIWRARPGRPPELQQLIDRQVVVRAAAIERATRLAQDAEIAAKGDGPGYVTYDTAVRLRADLGRLVSGEAIAFDPPNWPGAMEKGFVGPMDEYFVMIVESVIDDRNAIVASHTVHDLDDAGEVFWLADVDTSEMLDGKSAGAFEGYFVARGPRRFVDATGRRRSLPELVPFSLNDFERVPATQPAP